MPRVFRRFPRVQRGDRLAAAFVNDVTDAIERLESFGDGLDGLATSAGIAFRAPPFAQRQAVFRLQGTLTRTISAPADLQQWSEGEWQSPGTSRDLYGDFYRGCGLLNDFVTAVYHPVAARWFACGCGHFFLRGTLLQTLSSNGSAEMFVSEFDPETQLWHDTTRKVWVDEAVGLDEDVAPGTPLFATWHEQAGRWIATLAPCPADE